MTFKRPLPVSPTRQRISKVQAQLNNKNSCQVCGDKAHIFNYGALSCASCKTFFRRHGFHPETIPRCDFYGNCEITIQSRRMCTACRFSKCLDVGMSPDLIRKEDLTGKSRSTVKCKQQQQQQMIVSKSTMPNMISTPLNLLKADTSSLTPSNWTLLSNIIHAYDSFNPERDVRRTIELLSSNPVTFERRLQEAQNIVNLIYQTFQLSICSTADFRIMTTAEQSALIKRNMRGVWAFHSMVICTASNLFENKARKSVMEPLYGIENVERVAAFSTRLDSDYTLVKLILMVLSFSSNCFAVDLDQSIERDSLLMGTFRLFGSQNAYLEVMWKYMLYRYGYFESARRFSGLIKLTLDEISLSSEIHDKNKVHENLSKELVQELEKSLAVDGGENIPLWGKTVA